MISKAKELNDLPSSQEDDSKKDQFKNNRLGTIICWGSVVLSFFAIFVVLYPEINRLMGYAPVVAVEETEEPDFIPASRLDREERKAHYERVRQQAMALEERWLRDAREQMASRVQPTSVDDDVPDSRKARNVRFESQEKMEEDLMMLQLQGDAFADLAQDLEKEMKRREDEPN